MVSLAELQVGERVKILGFNSGLNKEEYQRRLLVMGLVPGAEFEVVRMAPLGDPVEIRLHNFSLCIRKREGAILQLERVEAFV